MMVSNTIPSTTCIESSLCQDMAIQSPSPQAAVSAVIPRVCTAMWSQKPLYLFVRMRIAPRGKIAAQASDARMP